MNITDSNDILTIHIDAHVTYYVSIIISSMGIFAILFAVQFEKILLAFFTILLTLIATIHSASTFEHNNIFITNGMIAADAFASVLLTFAIAYTLKLYKSMIGIFRVLWLVLLVTSSNSYAAISAFLGQSYIPNDVTVIAIAISVLVLFLMSVISRCKKNNNVEQSKKHLVSEYSLVLGGLILRFENEILNIITIPIGWPSWHMSCWISVITCSSIRDSITNTLSSSDE